MMMHPRKAFLACGISPNFFPINIITDLGIEKWRSQLNKHLGKTPFLPLPQAQLQPGHPSWWPWPPVPLLPPQSTRRPFGHAGGWAPGLIVSFCCSFLHTHFFCSGWGLSWWRAFMLFFQAALGIYIPFKNEHNNKVRIGIKWLEMFFQTGPGGISALSHRDSLRDVSAVGLSGQLPTAPHPCALSQVMLLSLFLLSEYLNCTTHVFKSIS